MSETLPLANVKAKFSEMVDRVEHTHDRIIVTRNGRPAAAIVEFMLGALLENPHRLGGELQRELSGMRSARRGVYRIVYETDDAEHLVIPHRTPRHGLPAPLPATRSVIALPNEHSAE